MIEAIVLNGSNETFRECIEIWGARRKFQRFDIHAGKDIAKFFCEIAASIMNEVAFSIEPMDRSIKTCQLTGSLLTPLSGWVLGDSAQNDFSGFQVNEKQDVEGGQPKAAPDFDSEEVASPDDVLVLRYELRPCFPSASLRC